MENSIKLFGGEPRDPKRIRRILDKLEKVWSEAPDFRFGQLNYNIYQSLSHGNDMFYIEDEKFEEYLDNLLKK